MDNHWNPKCDTISLWLGETGLSEGFFTTHPKWTTSQSLRIFVCGKFSCPPQIKFYVPQILSPLTALAVMNSIMEEWFKDILPKRPVRFWKNMIFEENSRLSGEVGSRNIALTALHRAIRAIFRDRNPSPSPKYFDSRSHPNGIFLWKIPISQNKRSLLWQDCFRSPYRSQNNYPRPTPSTLYSWWLNGDWKLALVGKASVV